MKRTFSKSAASAAAIALIATPAFAAPGGQGKGGENAQGKGQLTSPAKLCKSESKKKSALLIGHRYCRECSAWMYREGVEYWMRTPYSE